MLDRLTTRSSLPRLYAVGTAMSQAGPAPAGPPNPLTVFLCGDVMTGRGIDQVLPHPSAPRLYEPYVKTALDYVELAVQTHGPIPAPVDCSYIWGDALEAFARMAPDVRIINLETAITTSEAYWPDKGIHYRMHPANIPCLTAAQLDCCGLSNNHVLDWGYAGLVETLTTLHKAGVQTAGAGRNFQEAAAPAVLEVAGKGRVIVLACGLATSGIPPSWAARQDTPGVHLLPDVSDATVRAIASAVHAVKRPGDIVVVSLHWGSNWGYDVPREQRHFAHQLLAEAGVDILHGHSSHHPKGIEVYLQKPILYGCGDLLNDYEGISGYAAFRGDLALLYFVTMDPCTGTLRRLAMMPMQINRFRLQRVTTADAQWLRDTLQREGGTFGTSVALHADNTLTLQWD